MPPRAAAASLARVTRASVRASSGMSAPRVVSNADVVTADPVAAVEEGALTQTPLPKKRRTTKKDPASAAPAVGAAPIQDAEEAPPPKKRRTAKKKAAAPPTRDPSLPRTPPPPFRLSDAITHLTTVDRRFTPLFERIPCRPFVEAAALQPAAGAAATVAASTAEGAGDHGPKELVQTTIDPFRTLVTSIIGQQVSWKAAKTITKRFVELFCGPMEEVNSHKEEGPFPTAEQVSKAEVQALKVTGFSMRKAEYVIGLAQDFVAGRLTNDLLTNGTDSEIAEALIAVRGIGRWTIDMFLIFTLRRPDILPVGDLGVQKGLLRWALAAHNALPPPAPKTPKTPKKSASATPLEPPTPTPKAESTQTDAETNPESSPTNAEIKKETKRLGPSDSTATLLNDVPVTPTKSSFQTPTKFPSTPAPPLTTPSANTNPDLPRTQSNSIFTNPNDWTEHCAHRAAPLPDGLSIATLRSRLAGKKAKGGVYLLPEEMEALTQAWRPYRSLGVYYTWTMCGETSESSAS